MTLSSKSPLKTTEQPEPPKQLNELVTQSTSDEKTLPEMSAVQVSQSKNELPQTPSKQTTKQDKPATKKIQLEKVKGKRVPLQPIVNTQLSSSSSHHAKKPRQPGKENAPSMIYSSYDD